MSGQKHIRRTVEDSAVRDAFGESLAQVARGQVRIVLQQDGKDVAALISAADLMRFEHLERQRAERYKIVEEIQARNSHIDPKQAERDIAEELAGMRAEAKANTPAAPRT